MRYWLWGCLSLCLGSSVDSLPTPGGAPLPQPAWETAVNPGSGPVPGPLGGGNLEPWWEGFALIGPRRPYRRSQRRTEGRPRRQEPSRAETRLSRSPDLPAGASRIPEVPRGPVPESQPEALPPGSGSEPEPRKRGRPATIDTRFSYCPHLACVNYGKMGPENQIVGNGHCGHDKAHQLLLCKVCQRSFCERRGTVFFRCKTPPETICQALAALAEGLGLRATARVFGVDKDTVCAWLKKAAAHSEQVSDYLMQNLDLPEVQLDELWTFVQKKEKNLSAWEKLHTEYGDTWVWIAFDPLHKLVLAHVEGDREEAEAEALLQKVKSRLGSGLLPLFTSDGLRHYAAALLKVFGRQVQPARRGNRGRFPKPRWVAVPGLVYGRVQKWRVGRWVVGVTTQVIYGTWGQVWARLSAVSPSWGLNTAFVERMNLTLRHCNRRLTRKTLAFSKKREWLRYQLEMALAYYHFVRPHRSLRQRLPEPQATKGNGSPKRWQDRTPALAAGLTDHVWTMQELLSFRVPVGPPP